VRALDDEASNICLVPDRYCSPHSFLFKVHRAPKRFTLIAHHVKACHSTQKTMVQIALDDVVINMCLALGSGAPPAAAAPAGDGFADCFLAGTPVVGPPTSSDALYILVS